MNPKKILISTPNWIGDAVMSLAAIREVRRLFPNAHLSLFAKGWVASLFENQDLCDSVIPLPENNSWFSQCLNLTRQMRSFSQAILFQNSFRSAVAPFLAGVPQRIGYRRDGRRALLTHPASARVKKGNHHQIYYYLDLLSQSGLSSIPYLESSEFVPMTKMRVPSAAAAKSRALLEKHGISPLEPLVLVNPGAIFGSAKRWLPERYAQLADSLIAHGKVQVALIGSENERNLARTIAGSMTGTPLVLTGITDLPTLVGLLSQSRLLITNDSGPMHLAAALDTPQIALFGSTNENATGPCSPNATVIHKHVHCSPCLLRKCPIDLRCFTRISVDEVLSTSLRKLRSEWA